MKTKERLDLSVDEANFLALNGSNDNFEVVYNQLAQNYPRPPYGQCYKLVIKRKSDGKFFYDIYLKMGIFSNYVKPFHASPPNFIEAEKKERIIIEYI